MGGIPRIIKYNVPAYLGGLIRRSDEADIAGSMPDDPDMPMQSAASDPNYIQKSLRRNMGRLHDEAKTIGKVDTRVASGPFGSIPSYSVAKPMTIPKVDGRQVASVSKFNSLQGLKALYGAEQAGQIAENFIKYNQPGARSQPFAGQILDDPEKHLKRPNYLVHGDAAPDGADGYNWPDSRFLYMPRSAARLAPDVYTHEFAHAHLLSGDRPSMERVIDKRHLDSLHPDSAAVIGHISAQPDFRRALNAGDEDAQMTMFDLMERYNPASDRTAQDEVLADMVMWGWDQNAIRGGKRDSGYLESLFDTLLNAEPPKGDPIFQYGPRAGQPATGHARRQRSLNQLFNAPSPDPDDWMEALKQGLFRGGSMNTGHPKYPNA